ncbi:MAG: proline racemase family protein [Acidobacteria bacterium]|jgi:proline racemase|nr:proline racemase family protein [Acidobacteriota bacterium]
MTVDLKGALEWQPREGVHRIRTIDAHTGGEPFRVVLSGYPELDGSTLLERRRSALEHHDALRTALMWEPRGHADMYGCVLVPPQTENADFGILFLHNEGYSTMCGHGIIAIATVVLEAGILPAKEPETTLRVDTPAGLITARARVDAGRVTSVAFTNVPSFVLHPNREVQVPGLGSVRGDVAFGGAFYVFVDAAEVGVTLGPESFQQLINKGMAIKRALMAEGGITHPFEKDLSFLYGTIFTGVPMSDGADSRNVCVFAEGEVDRSPTGTGVSARAAIHRARGELEVGQTMVIEGIIGSRFAVRVLEDTKFGPFPAVIPEVEGSASITGRHEFLIDPDDPLRNGFILR